ncbi:MAG TPA: DUF2267 domain-containing protein, partial [Kaistiaceae bacterium]|nr:DUF2267 domain-containing protein [Kaistiaceae bacterium]
MTQPYDVEFASGEYQSWLADLKVRAMLQTHNQAQAMMRSVLAMFRRHMPTADVLDFADALPALPRGIFIGGYEVTEAARATRALRESEARLLELNADLERQVLERTQARGMSWRLSPDLMGALDAEGYFRTSNPAWQKIL